MSDLRTRRRSPRTLRRYKVTLQQSVCFTLNIGAGGFCVGIVRVLPPGTEVEGTIDMNGTAVPFSGTIAWANAGAPRLGVRGLMGVRFSRPRMRVASAAATTGYETTAELPLTESRGG